MPSARFEYETPKNLPVGLGISGSYEMNSSSGSSGSNLPASMGPGARPLQPGEKPGSLLSEITEIRSHYNVHVENAAVNIKYELNDKERSYHIPFENMPVDGWTKKLCWAGSNGALLSGTLLIDMVRACENITGRQITQPEVEGLAFYSSRKIMTMYVGQVVGLGVGYYAAFRGRKEMKFPFIKPKAPERYQNFPNRYLPILRGQFARTMWQITRFNIYAAMWLFLVNPLFRSVADTRMTVGLYADRRTHDLTEAVKGSVDRLRGNRSAEAARKVSQTQKPKQDSSGSFDSSSPTAGFYDDASPSNPDSFAADDRFTGDSTDTGMLTDRQIARRENDSASPNSWTKSAEASGSKNASSRSRPRAEEQTNSSSIFFDDASPTAGNDPDPGMAPQPRKGSWPGRGVWDRLRRGDQPTGGPQQEVANQTDNQFGNANMPNSQSGGYMNTYGNSASAGGDREEAQRNFDALLEKERQEGGANDYYRDMQATQKNAGDQSTGSGGGAWSRRRGG